MNHEEALTVTQMVVTTGHRGDNVSDHAATSGECYEALRDAIETLRNHGYTSADTLLAALDRLVVERDRLRKALEAIAWMSVVMPDGSVNTTASYHARVALEEGVSLAPRKETKGEISEACSDALAALDRLAAEAEVARLREALHQIVMDDIPDSGVRSAWPSFAGHLQNLAAAALATDGGKQSVPAPRNPGQNEFGGGALAAAPDTEERK